MRFASEIVPQSDQLGEHLPEILCTYRAPYHSLKSLLVSSSKKTPDLFVVFSFLTNLSAVQLDIAGGFDLDDIAIEEMARAVASAASTDSRPWQTPASYPPSTCDFGTGVPRPGLS
ncbi:hypothetical protein Hypma_001312 [Hypsizygus marmoreus]|uniref:Uncharacterized protein n=1 Tax=Hypsizygus marmoreus TaxID=39966 RepID=A0A369K3U4_HYPMA|nr:hypothetical protein Hypma_001312 [Hypsizygus marmoreus]